VTGDEKLFFSQRAVFRTSMMGVTGKHSGIVINCITDCDSVVLPTKTAERRNLLLTLSEGKPR
jgi:hypothetical protein